MLDPNVNQAGVDVEVEQGNGAERRRSPRVAYDAVVLIAPFDGATIPAAPQYVAVQTRDLSATGISFVTANPPRSRSILIVFGQSSKQPIIVAARVVHFIEFKPEPNRQFLVGCELLRRLPLTDEWQSTLDEVGALAPLAT